MAHAEGLSTFEMTVYERLEKYMQIGLGHDEVLQMIGRDFPCVDEKVRKECEKIAFNHYFSRTGGNIAANFKQMVLLHSKFIDKPFCSHQESQFQIRQGEDIFVAVQMENPVYLLDKANVHLSILINGLKVNEFRETMSKEERRSIYYIPLDILKNMNPKPGTCTICNIEIINEETKEKSYKIESEIYYGDVSPSGMFTLNEVRLFTDFCFEDKTVFDLGRFDTLCVHVSVNVNGNYGQIEELEGIVTLNPSDSAERRDTIVNCIRLTNNEYEEGVIEGSRAVCHISAVFCDTDSVPFFRPKPGKYTVKLFILGELFWSKEIEFIKTNETVSVDSEEDEDEEDDYHKAIISDALIEEFMNEMEAESVNAAAEDTFLNPFNYIEVIGLNLYNIDTDRDDIDKCLEETASLPLTAFNDADLKMLSVIGKIKKIKETRLLDIDNMFKCAIYDQTGRMVDLHFAKKVEIKEELWLCAAFGDFCRQKWSKGTYRLELQWMEKTIINAAFTVGEIDVHSDYDPKMICRSDNTENNTVEGNAIDRLEKMAGLKQVKDKVRSLMNFHKLQHMRSEAGLPVKQPCLHARFLGNPGTGKTTVARLLGQIYKEMGLLSSGHVVLEERKNLIGKYYDSEGQAVDNALNRAKGGILLIDEAYNLFVENDEKDPGRRILEYLLTALADENNRDWMLILAGYPKEMDAMLESNPGIKSRVNETFIFEDLDVDDLLEVADLYCDEHKYELSNGARERLRSVITRDVTAKDKNFGNGRYVNNLMETAINTRMASRLSQINSPTYDQLVTIEADDIPIDPEEAERISHEGFDEEAIDAALKRLDSLIGLSKVKSAIHNFVNISRFLHSQGERFRGKGLLKWNFTGNTGTGKSTVAQILADILKAMSLIQNNELTEIKGEEIFNVSDYTCNEVIKDAVKRSRRGLLFIDGDAPEFRSSQYRLTSEQVRFKLAALASDEHASGALIIAECSPSNLSIAHSLASNGIYDFDHTFIFDDYTDEELYLILLQCLEKQKTRVSEEAEVILREYIRNLCANRELAFANARTMKKLSRAIFETVILRMSNNSEADKDRVVLSSDVESFVWKRIPGRIGF